MQIDFGGGSEIGFERKGKAGLVKLTRTSALNALTHKMILALDRARFKHGKPIQTSPV
jgi:enoyl-CoA hydratase